MENYYYTQGGRGGGSISNSGGGRGRTSQTCTHGHYVQKSQGMAGGEHHCPHCSVGGRSSYNSARQSRYSYSYPEDDVTSSSQYGDQYADQYAGEQDYGGYYYPYTQVQGTSHNSSSK